MLSMMEKKRRAPSLAMDRVRTIEVHSQMEDTTKDDDAYDIYPSHLHQNMSLYKE